MSPFVDGIQSLIRQQDPLATFSAPYPAPDPGIWVIDAQVTPPLADDVDFQLRLAEHEVDLLIEHGVHLATLLLRREQPRPRRPNVDSSKHFPEEPASVAAAHPARANHAPRSSSNAGAAHKSGVSNPSVIQP